MKIRGFCNPCRPKLEFSDLRIGDVLTFPNNPSWQSHTFMIIWTSKIHGKKYEDIDEHTLIRLDGNPRLCNGNEQLWRCADVHAGQSYSLTRQMMERGIGTKPGGPERYEPRRWAAALCFEEEY